MPPRRAVAKGLKCLKPSCAEDPSLVNPRPPRLAAVRVAEPKARFDRRCPRPATPHRVGLSRDSSAPESESTRAVRRRPNRKRSRAQHASSNATHDASPIPPSSRRLLQQRRLRRGGWLLGVNGELGGEYGDLAAGAHEPQHVRPVYWITTTSCNLSLCCLLACVWLLNKSDPTPSHSARPPYGGADALGFRMRVNGRVLGICCPKLVTFGVPR